MNLFELVGTIAIVGAAQAQSDIDNTTKKASTAGETFKKGIITVGKWGLALGTASVEGAKALSNFATSSASTADNIDKMSQKIGISREAYQELDFICSQSGTSVDNLQTGMKTLTTAMDKAASGTSEQVEMFEKLGVAVTNSDGSLRSQEDVLFDTMKALQGVENQTEKARLTTELFGKSGTELMPLLNGASGSIEEMQEQAHDLGLVLDDEMIDSGVELSDTLDQLKRAVSSVVTKLGSSLMPILNKVSKIIIDNLPMIQKMFDKLAPVLAQLFDKLMPMLMNLAQQLLPIIVNLISTILPPLMQIVEAILPPFVEILGILLPPLIEIVETILPPIIEIISEILPILAQIVAEILPLLLELIQPILDLLHPLLGVLMPILSTVIQFISPLLQIITQILKPIISVLTTVFEKLSNFIKPIIQWMSTFIGGTLKNVLNVIMNVIGAVGEAFKTVWQAIKNVWSGAANFFSGIWNGIKNAFGSVADWFRNIFSKAWEAVKNVFSTGGKIFDGIKDGIVTAFKAVVNAIIRGINKVISIPFNAINKVLKKIHGVSILGVKPFTWIKTFDVPQIPELESGGVLKKGQVGFLEGNGAEAVVPLEKNKKWIHALAEDMRTEFGGSNNSALANKLDDVVNAISSIKVYLDTGAMVGEMTPAFDSAMGSLYSARERGR